MKAQITLFIIIGLVLVIAVGITLYATTFFISKPEITTSKVKDFVNECLKFSSEKVFEELGRNAGHLTFESARNVVPLVNPAFTSLISRPSHNIGCEEDDCLYYFKVPDYPWKTFPYFDSSMNEKTFVGYFGDSSLAPLFNSSANSIQEKAESMIALKVKQCANFDSFTNQGISVKVLSEPKVSIKFSNMSMLYQDKFTNIFLDWDIVESSDIYKKTLKSFSVKLPIRFSTIYYSVESIINNDISNISYVPQAYGLDVNVSYYDSFSVVNVTDTLSDILGKKFSFVFSRDNRDPALWYVELPTARFHVSDSATTPTRLYIENNKLMIKDPCEGVFEIPLNASSSDEEIITFDVEPKELFLDNKNLRIVAVDQSGRKDFQDFNVEVTTCT